MASDYSKSLTKDSQERSKIYQVVEAERRAKPDAKKNPEPGVPDLQVANRFYPAGFLTFINFPFFISS